MSKQAKDAQPPITPDYARYDMDLEAYVWDFEEGVWLFDKYDYPKAGEVYLFRDEFLAKAKEDHPDWDSHPILKLAE